MYMNTFSLNFTLTLGLFCTFLIKYAYIVQYLQTHAASFHCSVSYQCEYTENEAKTIGKKNLADLHTYA